MRINNKVIPFNKLLDFLIKEKKRKYYNSNLKLLLALSIDCRNIA